MVPPHLKLSVRNGLQSVLEEIVYPGPCAWCIHEDHKTRQCPHPLSKATWQHQQLKATILIPLWSSGYLRTPDD
ncbi:hypothetical protein PoB_007349400 [Plakobranchus ocellatus]|uniref:Uncharacterized protein n=1 Tax=Plakobranchus ocellatus TaxID=259542 RepID=A0AAV4DRX8_9GAST|nr:hypothetical protein PoB_007349400 [Plakobranchus ocellatus]